MRHKKIMGVTALVLLLPTLAGCPSSQCQDGSARTRTAHHRIIKETCQNNEWVKGK